MTRGVDAKTMASMRSNAALYLLDTCDIARDGESVAEDVPFTAQPAVISADGMRLHAQIAGLGGGRASHIGFVPHGTDVADGDVITSAGRTFAVQGVGYLDTKIGLALSEVGRG